MSNQNGFPCSLEKVSRFQCCKCGAWSNEETLVRRLDSTLQETPFGEALVWTEIHKCYCGHLWEFKNSNV